MHFLLNEFQEQIVGPSLGADSIEKARMAGLVGSALVFLFILFWYKIAGAIAMVTLFINVVIVLGFLVGLEATLIFQGLLGSLLLLVWRLMLILLSMKESKKSWLLGLLIFKLLGRF